MNEKNVTLILFYFRPPLKSFFSLARVSRPYSGRAGGGGSAGGVGGSVAGFSMIIVTDTTGRKVEACRR